MSDDDQSTQVPADDYKVRMYQDKIDTNPDDKDPVIPELTDDPVKVLQVPPDELAAELDKEDLEGTSEDDEAMREYIEDQDENDDSPASTIR